MACTDGPRCGAGRAKGGGSALALVVVLLLFLLLSLLLPLLLLSLLPSRRRQRWLRLLLLLLLLLLPGWRQRWLRVRFGGGEGDMMSHRVDHSGLAAFLELVPLKRRSRSCSSAGANNGSATEGSRSGSLSFSFSCSFSCSCSCSCSCWPWNTITCFGVCSRRHHASIARRRPSRARGPAPRVAERWPSHEAGGKGKPLAAHFPSPGSES